MRRLKNVIHRQKLVTAPPSATVFEIVQLMNESEVGAVPIVEDGVLVGVFSERDLLRRVISMIAMRDLLRDELEEQIDEIRFLRAYLHQTPPRG